MDTPVSTFLTDAIRGFGVARSEPFLQNPWRRWLGTEAESAFGQLARRHGLIVRGGSGEGGWPEIAWVGLRQPDLASSFNTGLYVAFLFNVALSGFTMSLQQGITEVRREFGLKLGRSELSRRARMIRAGTTVPPRLTEEVIDLGASDRRGRLYQSGHICGRSYLVGDSDPVDADLNELINYYISLGNDRTVLSLIVGQEARAILDESFEGVNAGAIEALATSATRGRQTPFDGTRRAVSLVRRRIGQAALRKALLRSYEAACAACGEIVSTVVPSGALNFLEAAHIVPVSDGGSTWVGNGLLLCPNHHWAFDNHCWTIGTDLRIVVMDRYKAVPLLASINGRELPEPRNLEARVHPDAAGHHRKATERRHPAPEKQALSGMSTVSGPAASLPLECV